MFCGNDLSEGTDFFSLFNIRMTCYLKCSWKCLAFRFLDLKSELKYSQIFYFYILIRSVNYVILFITSYAACRFDEVKERIPDSRENTLIHLSNLFNPFNLFHSFLAEVCFVDSPGLKPYLGFFVSL